MSSPRQKRIKELFVQACSVSPSNRPDLIDRMTADDPEIRAEVLDLLQYHDESETSPTIEVDDGFEAGFLFADRYRIISELGRGGMGRVYRAHDTVLDVPVALKLLSDLSPTYSERLLEEVRLARSVSHPNVCRVFDIGMVGEDPFLTMEYVDGEDLAALLRRIGRLPPDKLLDLARQLCAGVAAAHAKGIVHRDLKPANIMIDGEGQVRITDFGIATAATRSVPLRLQPGTPAYMAPEQLSGCGSSVASDLYSMGLVLYEMATGAPVFRGDTPVEIAELHSTVEPERPTDLVDDLDADLEAVILRLLEQDPAKRPKSALAVAAMLPGGDPLNLAREVGATPPPEIVAVAPAGKKLLTPALAIIVAATLVAMLVGVMLLSDRARNAKKSADVKAPAALAERASQILRELGREPGEDREWGFVPTCEEGKPLFWYLEGPDHIEPGLHGDLWSGRVTLVEPRALDDEMVQVILDGTGRLRSLDAGPAKKTDHETKEPGAVDWPSVVEATGLGFSEATPAETVEHPPMWADTLKAWKGPDPDGGNAPLHIDAAAAGGALVFVDASTTKDTREDAAQQAIERNKVYSLLFGSFLVLLVVAAVIGAWVNVRSGRGDLSGARRLAILVAALRMAQGLLYASHVPVLHVELTIVAQTLGAALAEALVITMIYLAMEPTVRRLLPEILIGWNRFYRGRLRDPVVGQSLFLGALVGAGWTIIIHLDLLIVHRLGLDSSSGYYLTWGLDSAISVRLMAADMLDSASSALYYALAATLLLAVFHKLFSRRLPAMVAFFLVVATLVTMDGANPALSLLTVGITVSLSTYWLLTRGGLLAYLTALLSFNLLLFAPTGIGQDAWYASMGMLSILLVAAFGSVGLWLTLTTKEVTSY